MPRLERLSILVVSWNGLEHLETCLESLSGQRPPGVDVEILLFDNGSTDGTAERVRRRFPGVRLHRSERNLGFAEANDRLAEVAEGDALVLVNNDTRARPEWLAALADAYASAPGDVAGIAGAITDWEGERLDFGRGVMTFDGHAFALDQGRPLVVARQPASGDETLFGCGGNLLVRRRSFLDAGGFDPRYFAYFEDVDLGWRLWAGGERLLYSSEAAVHHRASATSRRLGNRRRGAMFERNAMWTMLKNLEPALRTELLPAIFATYLSRIGALLAAGGVEGLATAHDSPGASQHRPRASVRRRLAGHVRDLSRRAAGSSGDSALVVRSEAALAQLEALGGIFGGLTALEDERRRLLARRTRSDREIFERFPLWIVPTYPGDERFFDSEFFASLLPAAMQFERAALAEVIATTPE